MTTYDYVVPGVEISPDAVAIQRAKEFVDYLRSGHDERARLIQCFRDKESSDEWVVIEVKVSLPQRPAHDLRPLEPIAVRLSSSDRTQPRIFSLRKDFPYPPHINLQPKDSARDLCLYDRPWHEVSFSWTGAQFAARIIWWLEETAHGSLHQNDQPLEPLLFGSFSDLIIPPRFLDGTSQTIPRWATIRKIPRHDNTYALLLDQSTSPPWNDDSNRCLLMVMTGKPVTHGVVRFTPDTLGDLQSLVNDTGISVVRELRDRFARWNFQFTEHELIKVLEARLIIAFKLRKRRQERGGVEDVELRAFEFVDPIGSIGAQLGVRWSGGRYGPSSGAPPSAVRASELQVSLLNVREGFSRQLGSRTNGLRYADQATKTVAIGLGSLGSQVVLNLARSGYGDWTLVDDDVLLPHNLGRHALGPGWVGTYKAEALSATLSEMVDDPSFSKPLVANVLREGGKSSELASSYENSDFILDMAASVPVSRHLVNGVESNARRVSLFLNPAGTALTLLGEDEDRNIPLDMLEMQFYREIVANSKLRDLLRHPIQTRTGLTCRDVSAEISQENVAIHSGMGSRAFRLFASGSAAQIRTWQFGEHLDYTLVMDLVPAAISCELIQGWTVFWDALLADKLMQWRECRLPKETGGILTGSYDQGRRAIYIVDALPSPIDSQESRSSYIRGTRRLKGNVNRIVDITDGMLEYVGEWHSHPDGYGIEPSVNDRSLLEWVKEGMETVGHPGLIGIVGSNNRLGVYL